MNATGPVCTEPADTAGNHSRLRLAVVYALDALEVGDHGAASDFLLDALDDIVAAPADPNRCSSCGLWPGQRWACRCSADDERELGIAA